MSDKKFQTIIDCGFSKIRAGAFNEEDANNPFFIESNFYTDQCNFRLNIQKIVALLETRAINLVGLISMLSVDG